MYQIIRITDKDGAAKTGPEYKQHRGCIGDAKMEDGCVLMHCRYNRQGEPCDRYIRTSLVQNWQKDKETGRIVIETMNSIYHLDPLKMD
ncbi:MAG: hypothetical protein K2O18_13370 [Oscillospiraceae bacterium]|nr:hypothetical protein [Oscillospiraceae bacterium]